MKKFTVLFIFLLILVVTVTPAAAITWGDLDTEHTNVGAMVVDDPAVGVVQWCSGTLIHPQVFLTAGHCTDDLEPYGITTVWVNFDPYALNTATLLDVAEVITHPDYNWGPTSNPHDIGVLILEDPVTDVTPATLPPVGYLDQLAAAGLLHNGSYRAEFTVVGYGGTLEWPPPNIVYDDYRQVAESEFLNLHTAWLHMSQNQATGDGGTCKGDSGGPTFWQEADGSETLVAVTSWGDVVCVATGTNYRVDLPETLNFIAAVIANLQ